MKEHWNFRVIYTSFNTTPFHGMFMYFCFPRTQYKTGLNGYRKRTNEQYKTSFCTIYINMAVYVTCNIMAVKMQIPQWWHHAIAHLKTYLQGNQVKIPNETLVGIHNPRMHFWCCETEWQNYKVVKTFLSQLFLKCVAGLKCIN